MLTRSFLQIPGVGEDGEKQLWNQGILDWSKFREAAPGYFPEAKLHSVLERLDECETAYERKDYFYFYRSLPRNANWRLIPEFPQIHDHAAYLDIETTGTGMPPAARSTTITFYFKGQVLQEYEPAWKAKLIKKILAESSLLVTFFGESFDVPFLSREFGVPFEIAHIDLCFWLKRLGYHGGLKKVQKAFPDIPERQSMDINGYDAVRLWKMHQEGVKGALDTLLTYNAEDTVVLAPLLAKAYNLEIARDAELERVLFPLAVPELPMLQTQVDRSVYDLLRSQNY